MSLIPYIRLLTRGDAPELMALRHRALQECPAYFGTPLQIELAKTVEGYRKELTRNRVQGNAAILGMWKDTHLIGMVGLKIRRRQGEESGLIYSMYIDPELRGKGLGKKLLIHARKEMRQRWQLDRCVVNVEVHNLKALGLYQDSGFQIIDTETAAFWIDGRPHDVHLLEWRIPAP